MGGQFIFVIEDDDNIRELLLYALTSAGFTALGVADAPAFQTALAGHTPCLLILDIMLPGKDGFSILKELKKNEKTQNIPVIILTAKSAEYDRIKGLEMGADDYITKPFSVMEVIARIKAVLRRSKPETSAPPELRIGMLYLHEEQRIVSVNGAPVSLTYKEFELLHCLMRNKNRVLSRDKLLEQVWGFEYFGESRTVDMHIKTLRQKLGAAGSAIKTVRNVGYKIEE
ncbi:MAG: response regulator transcription factor [Spirochaetaceae bacterium]|jgi:two-component system alkaline phosphatase synthesis response regulator PhoP|nr:response regulator transcription factor [Spirochaetaceae bacterium]